MNVWPEFSFRRLTPFSIAFATFFSLSFYLVLVAGLSWSEHVPFWPFSQWNGTERMDTEHVLENTRIWMRIWPLVICNSRMCVCVCVSVLVNNDTDIVSSMIQLWSNAFLEFQTFLLACYRISFWYCFELVFFLLNLNRCASREKYVNLFIWF